MSLFKIKAVTPFQVRSFDHEAFVKAMGGRVFVTIRPGEARSIGLVPFESGDTVLIGRGHLMVNVRIDKRKVTPAMVRFEVDRIIGETGNTRQGMSRTEIRDLSDRVTMELLKTTIPTAAVIPVIIERKEDERQLFVLSSSVSVCDEVLTYLMESGMSCARPDYTSNIGSLLTRWLRSGDPHSVNGLEAESKVKLSGVDGEKATFTNVPVFSDEPVKCAKQRKMTVDSMEVSSEHFVFTLSGSGSLSGVKMQDAVETEALESELDASEMLWFDFIALKLGATFATLRAAAEVK